MSALRLLGVAAAGGASSRMGQDKALLRWSDTTLLDHTIDRLRSVCAEVAILSGARRRYGPARPREILDQPADVGPLGGLSAALETAAAEGCDGVFLLAIDLPFVTPGLIDHVAAGLEDHDVAAPHAPRGPEPLCAAYRTTVRDALRRSLARGDNKMTAFWPAVRSRLIEEPQLRAFGDPEHLFANVNRPEDYERAVATRR